MRKDFQRIIALSEQMLVKARSSKWDELLTLENERGVLMEGFFSQQIDNSAKQRVTEGIQLILEKDREVAALSVARRKVLRSSLSKMGKNKNAVQAYAASA